MSLLTGVGPAFWGEGRSCGLRGRPGVCGQRLAGLCSSQQLLGWPTIGSLYWDLLWYWQLLPYKHTPHIDGLDAFEIQLTLSHPFLQASV